jgi:ketosteroid isomerase-like protein
MSKENVEAFKRGLEAGNRGDIDALLDELHEAFAEVQIEMSEFRDLGDGLVATGRTRTRGKASGVEMKTPLAFVTEIRNGKTISIRAYLDRDEALEAAALSE